MEYVLRYAAGHIPTRLRQISRGHRPSYDLGMAIVLGVLAVGFVALLAFGAVTGRVRLKSCCAVADPRRDLRMREAFTETSESTR